MKETLMLSKLGHTWILDIDGTIVKHNGYKMNGEDTLLPGAKEFFDSIPDIDMIIFITSRTLDYKEQTENFLLANGIRFDYIIYSAPYGERILVNDNKPSGLEMSKAVCLDRDSGVLFDVQIDENL